MAFIQEDGIYSLINVEGGTCLSGGKLPPFSRSARIVACVPIVGIKYNNEDLQTWLFQRADAYKTFTIKSTSHPRHPGDFLSTRGKPNDGETLIVGISQFWQIEEESGVDGGVRLFPASNPDLCVELADGGSSAPETPIRLSRRGEGKNQIWKLQKFE